MKFRYTHSAAVILIGAVIGMTLAYFGTGSVDASSLSAGAVLGALTGLSLALLAGVPSGGPTSGWHSGMG